MRFMTNRLHWAMPLLLLAMLAACTAESSLPSSSTDTNLEPTMPPATAVVQTEPVAEPTLPPPAIVIEEPAATESTEAAEAPAAPEPIAATDDSGDLIAYLSEGTLYIHDQQQGTGPVVVEQTIDDYTDYIAYPIWSPDGEYLLYYRVSPDTPTPEIRVADRQGNWQTVGTGARNSQPAAWSPDGQQIVYLRASTEMTADQSQMILPVQLIQRLPEGGFAPEVTHGTILLMPDGCGGGGRSMSETLYENENGTAYGYRMGVLAWSAQDVLLLTNNCANVGISRYDMASATQLASYEGAPLRNLTLTPDKTGWVAVHGWPYEPESGQLAIGDPTAVDFTLLPANVPVELAFVGQQSGDIFYTTRRAIPNGLEDTDNEMRQNFRFYETSIWRRTADGTETEIHMSPAHAIARLQEGADGSVLFVWVENETRLVEALLAETAVTDWAALDPQRHIARLVNVEGSNTAVELIPNAGSLAVAP